ncbi:MULTISPECIES: DegT/DnrJ/EryC1/StrS family aminotransferase [Streptomyces]|uniref:DegT/DnrJ/EryC1/StrS family aminotransferase n=1 Tax=Streptomyces TaxID=1883 RepID=UPI00367FE7B3
MQAQWPVWPRGSENGRKVLADTLFSGRWTLSGPWAGRRSNEQEFAAQWAEYNGAAHCVPTANGTSALTIAMEALDVGYGDEVIVPGLTWVASASAVLNLNAVPVLVDIDPATLCIDPAAVESAITPRTKAIVVVHLYCSMADMDAILDIGQRHGIPVIEDSAQAHGARWRGAAAGTLGRIGTFSMQETKLLTAGEGGAAITDDPELFDRMFQLHADGRRQAQQPLAVDQMELVEKSSVMGNNYCLSEFGAGVLIDQLALLEDEHRLREENAQRLTKALDAIPGVSRVQIPDAVTRPTYYHYAVRYDPAAFAGKPLQDVIRALTAELGFPVNRCYPALQAHPLYQPHTKRRYRLGDAHVVAVDPRRFELPNARRAHDEVFTFHHRLLLAGTADIDSVAEAISKVARSAHEIETS